MTGYTRQSLAEIQDGEDIVAGPLNDEFDALQSAFNGTTGHTHDGTTGSGPLINLTNAVNGVLPLANGGTGQATTTAFAQTLLDDASASAARTTLGLGTSATVNTGTSGATIPLLSGLNTWSSNQTISNTTPRLSITDTDTNLTSVFSASSAIGSLFIGADDTAGGTNPTISFQTQGTTRASVTSNGLEISSTNDVYSETFAGTPPVLTSSTSAGYYLDGAAKISVSRSAGDSLALQRTTSDGTLASFFRQTTLVGTISVTTTATAYNTSSDVRLKQDFQPINPKLIDLINVYDFEWINGSGRAYGVKAQELYEIIPQAVHRGEDPKVDMWSVDYSKLVPLLIAKVQDLEARLAILEGK